MSSILQIKLVIVGVFCFPLLMSCGVANYDRNVNDLVREANGLLAKEAAVVKEFRNEYVSVFTIETRGNFPSNRDVLRPHAENQIRLLREQKSFLSAAIEKFERASAIAVNHKDKRFTSLMAESLHRDIEIADYFIETMNLVLDEKVVDAEVLKSKFIEYSQKAELKARERDALQSEARQTIGQE